MARVPKSTGQGVSRKSYMSGWRASHPQGGPAVKAGAVKSDAPVAGRSYGKSGFQPPPGAMAIDYEPSVFDHVSNLKEAKALGTAKLSKDPGLLKVPTPKKGKGL